MDEIVEFFTSKTGIFAAVTALVAFTAAVIKLVEPVLKKRRDAEEAVPDLQFSSVQVNDPPPYSEAGEATFQLVNARGGKAVLRDLLLVVLGHGATERPKMTEAAAPIPEFTYKVTLSPGVTEYDVRKKEFGSAPPHSYEASEIEAFRIELRSAEPQWYDFEFVVRWYDARRPTDIHELRTPKQRIEFLPDIADVL